MIAAQLRGLTMHVPALAKVVFVLEGKELEFNLCEFHAKTENTPSKIVFVLKEKPQ